MDVVTPHLQNLVPYLITLLNDPEPLCDKITCWTLGRYSSWGANSRDPNHQSHFVPMILKTMLDRNKKVQEAGASAFAHLEENAGRELSPYYQQIIQQFVNCFHKYKDRNMFILYDCVQTLAERVGEDLARPELVKLLMPALIHRWEKVADQSRELIPLLQCLSYVATALGNAFVAYAPPVCSRCIKIIHQNIKDYAVAVNSSDTPDTDFLVTSLDLLSAIVQVLDRPMSAELVSSSEPDFFELLTFCTKNPANNVRQSSYTLLGHCAIYVFPQLQPFLPGIMPILIEQLDVNLVIDEQIEDGFSAVNNACWSAGKISIQYGKGMAPYVELLFQRLLNIIVNQNIPQSVNENAAIAIGRLGLENSELIAPHISMFATRFLDSMDAVDYTSAVTGFTLTVGRNHLAIEKKDLVHFFTTIARYKHENKERLPYKESLSLLFGQALHAYKGLPDFRAFLLQLTPVDQQELLRTYNL